MSVVKIDSHCSLPLVDAVGGLDALELPQIFRVQVHGSRVSLSESLSDPGVVHLLAVTELEVADASADSGAKEGSEDSTMHVHVVVVGAGSSVTSEVGEGENTTKKLHGQRLVAAEDLVLLADVEEVHVEQLGVVLDELDGADAVVEIRIIFLDVLLVADDFRSSSHFLEINCL